MIGKIGSGYNIAVPAALRPVAPVAERAARGDFDKTIDQTGAAVTPSSQRDTVADDNGAQPQPRQPQNALANTASNAYSAVTIDADEPQNTATGYGNGGKISNLTALSQPRGNIVDLIA
ncbi:hypothetical protein [Thalassospira sp. MCCC 1A01428]|uniref:hypothetical protein n=1 Tax=Thalassospira sp. MCCC 1A01428 TaxID=1470575 RepID=UPI000A1EE0D4|nr:hypothetical protein [Thalassospira sp. MCCC 1A01428]OSQ45120.1 hypothetical protein THS27_05470 [Thalassospira sp. MCCC 1A01428]